MIKRGKSINMFLINGDINGCVKCTLKNWTGIAYRIPRIKLSDMKERLDLKQSGIYFLFGISDDFDKNIAYIGQANIRQNNKGILNRLEEHKRNPEKDYWNEAIVFTTSNNSLGSTELNYLENKLCDLAIKANRYIIKNGNLPHLGNTSEEIESDMDEFIDYIKSVMVVLGHKLLMPLTTEESASPIASKELILYLKIKRQGILTEAVCKQTSDGYVLLKGSQINQIESKDIPEKIKLERKISKIDLETKKLLEDKLFNSPTYAAVFVLGRRANGRKVWKTLDGKSLEEIEADAD